MRIIFMGSPDFAVPTLDALVEARHEVVAAYTQPPRPAGRGKAERPTPVEDRAGELGIEVRSPTSLGGESEQEAFAELEADVAVVAAYGLILPQPILDAPSFANSSVSCAAFLSSISTARLSSIGPVSSPASICMMVTPVHSSPAMIAR